MSRLLKYKKSLLALGVLALGVAFLSLFGWKSFVPKELKSGSFEEIYEADGTHFFGPSGISKAFVVFSISNETVEKLQTQGLEYLQNLPSTEQYEALYETYEKRIADKTLSARERSDNSYAYFDKTRALYKDWQATPIKTNEERWNRSRNKEFLGLVRKGWSAERRWKSYEAKYKMYDRKYKGLDIQCRGSSLCSFYGDYKMIPPWRKTSGVLRTLDDMNFVDDITPEYTELTHKILNTPGSYFGYGESGVLIISPEHKKLFFLYRG